MVSGLVTSPCDQLRIFSGEASWILMASKSAMLFPRSNGLERYKVPPHLNFQRAFRTCGLARPPSASGRRLPVRRPPEPAVGEIEFPHLPGCRKRSPQGQLNETGGRPSDERPALKSWCPHLCLLAEV